jgi:hypothetical protein
MKTSGCKWDSAGGKGEGILKTVFILDFVHSSRNAPMENESDRW